MKTTLNYIFQVLPVFLACIAAISCSLRYSRDRRKHDRVAMLMAATASVLLIIAQTSWWVTYLVENSLQGTVFANTIWTVFNSLIMLVLIVLSYPWRK